MNYSSRRSSVNDYNDRMPLNNSYGKLQRINLWFTVAGRAKIEGLLDEYFNALENVYSDIFPHLEEEEAGEIDEAILEIERFLDGSAASSLPSGQAENFIRLNRRRGSNLCDKLRLKLGFYAKKYKLEWLDVEEWSQKRRDAEPVVRG